VTVLAPDRDGSGAQNARIAHAAADRRGKPHLTWEPVSGIEPLTCRLQDCGRSMARGQRLCFAVVALAHLLVGAEALCPQVQIAPVFNRDPRGADHCGQVSLRASEDVKHNIIGGCDLPVAVVPGKLDKFE
jgi:hypothetical protein